MNYLSRDWKSNALPTEVSSGYNQIKKRNKLSLNSMYVCTTHNTVTPWILQKAHWENGNGLCLRHIYLKCNFTKIIKYLPPTKFLWKKKILNNNKKEKQFYLFTCVILYTFCPFISHHLVIQLISHVKFNKRKTTKILFQPTPNQLT